MKKSSNPTDNGPTKIRALVLDIDGVLTDGSVGVREEGKRLFLRDLDALTRIRRLGVEVAFLTGESKESAGPLVERCGGGVSVFGAKDKDAGLRQIASTLGVEADVICYVGDADRDSPALHLAGVSFAPGDASIAAKRSADHTLRCRGGRGVVEEVEYLVFGGGLGKGPRFKGSSSGDLEDLSRSIETFSDHVSPELENVIALLAACIDRGCRVIVVACGEDEPSGTFLAAGLAEKNPDNVLLLREDSGVSFASTRGNSRIEDTVDAAVQRDDVLFFVSADEVSETGVRILDLARQNGVRTIALIGSSEERVGDVVDMSLSVPDGASATIRGVHLVILNIVTSRLARMSG